IDQMKPQKIGYIFQEGPFGELLGAGVKAAVESKGMTLTAQAGYKVGDLDFSSQVARMQAAGVDLVVTATIIRETIGVAGEIKKLVNNHAMPESVKVGQIKDGVWTAVSPLFNDK